MIDTLCLWTGRISLSACGLLLLWLAAKWLHIRFAETRRLQGIRASARRRLAEIRREDAQAEAMRAAWRLDGLKSAPRMHERAARVEANHEHGSELFL